MSNLYAEDSHAKTSALLDGVLASPGIAVDSSSTPYDLRGKSKHKRSSWRMCQDFYQATKDAISESSSLNWPTQGIATSNGEFWIRNSSESPNDAVDSSLSQILETDPPIRYSLSPKACAGILARAERRGKTLPEPLRTALLHVCSASDTTQ